LLSKETERYLKEVQIPLRLSCVTESGWPMVLSLWYVYMDGKIYCATVETAKVVEYLRKEPRCAFEVATDEPPYCGIRGQARATIIKPRGAEILKILLERYLGGTDSSLAKKLLKESRSEVAIELQTINYAIWDFTERMKDVVTKSRAMPCPSA
jgi:nitroimidazol reductase NimA-like FMN-containing flavoprotein (pyridoxamine 5'-phosphate oxidase superfamily)